MADLTNSVRIHGVLQPVLVRAAGPGKWELIAGERRWRAAQAAGLDAIPAVIRTDNDEYSMAVALIENLQRADLNPMEQAEAFERLASQFKLTQEQISHHTGKDRATIANYLRLLRLDQGVREMVRRGALSFGQARPLVGLEPVVQMFHAMRIAEEGWSVRRVEQLVAKIAQNSAALEEPEKLPPPRDPNIRDAEEQLSRALGCKVIVKADKRNRGSIQIFYNDLEEFQRLYDRVLPA